MVKSRSLRWTGARKREIVSSIFSGVKTTEQVLSEYPDLSIDELQDWMLAYERGKGEASHLNQKSIHRARRHAPA